ncbi:MAG TPA: HupE/UreJ family protein [Chthoniobacterales bacterium]
MRKFSFASLLLMLCLPAAQAHPGHDGGMSLFQGFGHPLTGLDHLLAMVAAGLWAAQIGGRALWVIPVSFVLAMLGGGIAGMNGLALPFLEPGIALSVLLLGLAIAFAFRPPLCVPAILVAAFAIFHGMAHGSEMPATAFGFTFGLGFLLATALLHVAGIALGLALKKVSPAPLIPALGVGVALLGGYLLIG